jgi:hypothetical protein
MEQIARYESVVDLTWDKKDFQTRARLWEWMHENVGLFPQDWTTDNRGGKVVIVTFEEDDHLIASLTWS